MAFYGYARASTGRRAPGLEAQELMLRGMAQAEGGKLDRLFREEGGSDFAHLAARPQGRALLEAVRRGDVILATAFDRLFHSALDALGVLKDLESRGVRVMMKDVGGHETTKLMGLISVFATNERQMLAVRSRAASRTKGKAGRYMGGRIPFGYEVTPEGALKLTPEGAAARAELRRLRAGGLSLRSIAATMTKAGRPVSHMGVSRAMKADQRGEAGGA